MYNNDRWDESSIKKRLYENCRDHVKSDHVLCIEDTTEVNCSGHAGRFRADDPDIGPVTKASNMGFFCHPMLVVDATTSLPLGFSSVQLWNRDKDTPNKKARKYTRLPIEEKESYRWIESARESLSLLPEGVRQTVIADRESDIYEAFCQIPNERCDLLIRSSSDRLLCGEEVHLLEKMCSLPVQDHYELVVKGNHSRKNRTTHIELRYSLVEIKRPETLKDNYPGSRSLYCIYALEDPHSVPAGESPIEWRLLTTHRIDSVEKARQCIEWYKLRWYIEEVFRLLKSEGMHVEEAQLGSGAALKKLVLNGLVAAWHIMTLKLAYDKENEQETASLLFTDLQIKLLQILLTTLEGKTKKQQNPYMQTSLAWAAWIIARLGGWSGYVSQAKAGYITFRDGYKDFHSKYQAFEAMINVYRE